MTFAVTEKGQVTIPKGVRTKLGIRPGTRLAFAAENGRLVATKAETTDHITKWRGHGRLPGKLNVDRYLKKVRDGHRD